MKKTQFLALVLEELNAIKERATPEEIAKLDFRSLQINSSMDCIYGQMTGYCGSTRAAEIYPKSFDGIVGSSGVGEWDDYRPFSSQNNKEGKRYTALEKYLFTVANKNCDSRTPKHLEIIRYLKGEIGNIKL